jgi:hypothetical protein
MLSSITPLGERGRGQRFGITAASLLLGATGAGAALGAALGGLGAALPLDATQRLVALAAATAVGLALDLLPGRRLPTHLRQVDERWLHRYRGWVYGLGFGAQLGVGVATVVTSSAVYLTLAGEALAPSIAAGTVVGGVFGAIRGGSVLLARRIDSPARLVGFHGRLARLEGPTATATLTLQALAVVAALAVAA